MARYKDAVEWIALNDNSASYDTSEEIRGYLSVALVADVWRKTDAEVADDVEQARMRWREKNGYPILSTNDESR